MTTPPPTDYTLFVELLQRFSSLSNDLALIEGDMTECQLKAATAAITEYAVLQEQVAQLEQRIAAIFAAHPEWREKDSKSIKTPFGSVSCKETKKLKVQNEAVTITLIKALAAAEPKSETWPALLRVTTELDKEALEKLSDEQLEQLGVTREVTEPITVKPFKADAAKAVKAAAADLAQN